MLKINNEILMLWNLLTLDKNPVENFFGVEKTYTQYELMSKFGCTGQCYKLIKKFEAIGILKNTSNNGKKIYAIDIGVIERIYRDSIYFKIGKRIKELQPTF
jgi:hypothetical protein